MIAGTSVQTNYSAYAIILLHGLLKLLWFTLKTIWHVLKSIPQDDDEDQRGARDDQARLQYQRNYENNRRVHGEFKCPECHNRWSSGQSWPNMSQQCKECHTSVYPHTQRPLEHRDKIDININKKPHRSDLCEKCKRLGRNCRTAKTIN